MRNRVDTTVLIFCVHCGSQLRVGDPMCSCCGAEAIEVSRVTLPRQGGRERRPGPHGRDDDAEDPFYLM